MVSAERAARRGRRAYRAGHREMAFAVLVVAVVLTYFYSLERLINDVRRVCRYTFSV